MDSPKKNLSVNLGSTDSILFDFPQYQPPLSIIVVSSFRMVKKLKRK